MQPSALLAIAVLASAAVSYGIVSLAAPKPLETGPADSVLEQKLATMQRTVEDQQRTIERMSRQAQPADGTVRSSVPSVSEAQVETAILSWLEKHAGDAAPGSLADAAAKLTKGAKASTAVDVKALYLELGKIGGDWTKVTDVWKRAKESGQIDALVALYEQNAKDNPSVADAQKALGDAYLQKLFHGTIGPEAGIWGTKADKAFDQALELDPNHWGARFQKAVSLSNWPDFLGKKKEAIDNFETLVKQQESAGNTQPQGWNTYLMLGNLYSQQGKDDKAKDFWERGVRAFPDNQSLKDKVAQKK